MTKQVVGTDNHFYIGSPNVYFPFMTAPGAAKYLVPTEQQGTHQCWYDYATDGNVTLSQELKGVVLTPATEFVDMDTAHFTSTGRDALTLVTPPNNIHNKYIGMVDNTANTTTEVASDYNLPASPSILLDLVRQPTPPVGQDMTQLRWQFCFGGGYVLDWTSSFFPALWHDGEIISQFVIPNEDKMKFFFAQETLFQLNNKLGQLTITSNAFSGTWVVNGVGDIPSAPFTVIGGGGQFWFNVSALTFQTSGYLITPWVEHSYAFNNSDLVAVPFPPASLQPAGTSVDIAVEASSGTMKQYRVSYTSDGTATPLVQGIYVEYAPKFATLSTLAEKEITPWVDYAQSPPTEELTADFVTNQLTFEITPQKTVNGQTFSEFVGDIYGQVPFRYTVGLKYSDGSSETHTRMTGLLGFADRPVNISEVERVKFRAKDRWKQLQECSLMYPPCLQSRSVGGAIAALAAWAGIAPGDMVIDSAAYAIYLDDPGTDYTSPPWLPQRCTRAAEVIKHICEVKGFLAYFNPYGQLVVTGSRDTTCRGAYTICATTNAAQSLTKMLLRTDTEGIINGVFAEGMGPDGQRYEASMIDWNSITSPSSPRFVGYPCIEYLNIPDCLTPTSLTSATAEKFATRHAGWPWFQLEGTPASDQSNSDLGYYAMSFLLPNMTVQATDRNGNAHPLLITQMRQTLGLGLNTPTLIGEDRSINA
jgi:hypothetical protein